MPGEATVEALVTAAGRLHEATTALAADLPPPVAHVHAPLGYAWPVHEVWLQRFGGLGARCVLLGMNPGPWGMGQTGVPFGDPVSVRDLLGLRDLPVGQPEVVLPTRPVIGLDSPRREVSGQRIWGVLSEVYGSAEAIGAAIHVVNHCPLLLFDEGVRNVTPDKLRGEAAERLQAACDVHLAAVVEALGATRIVGVGVYAAKAAARCLGPGGAGDHVEWDVCVLRIPHPSPASPIANKDGGAPWRAEVHRVLSEVRHAEQSLAT